MKETIQKDTAYAKKRQIDSRKTISETAAKRAADRPAAGGGGGPGGFFGGK